MTLLDGGTRDAEPHQIVPHSFPRFLYEMAFHITIEKIPAGTCMFQADLTSLDSLVQYGK
jgi:hypothetical protein